MLGSRRLVWIDMEERKWRRDREVCKGVWVYIDDVVDRDGVG